MLVRKLTVIMTLQSDQYEESLLSLHEQQWNIEQIEVLVFAHDSTNRFIVEQMLSPFHQVRIISFHDIRDYIARFNEQLRSCDSEYITILDEKALLEPHAWGGLLRVADAYQSDIVMGIRYEWDEYAHEYRKPPLFQYEKLKKYYYNSSLNTEPALAQLIGLTGNAIIRTAALHNNQIELTLLDGEASMRELQRRLFMQSSRITYLPRHVVNAKPQRLSIDNLPRQLLRMNNVANRVEPTSAKAYYEVAAVLDCIELLESSIFVRLPKWQQTAVLEEIAYAIASYQLGFITAVLPAYKPMLVMLQKGDYSGTIEHIAMAVRLKQSRARAKLYSRQYNQLKRNVRGAVLRLYKLAHNTKQLLKGSWPKRAQEERQRRGLQDWSSQSELTEYRNDENLLRIQKQVTEYSKRIRRYETYINQYEPLIERKNYRRLMNIYGTIHQGWLSIKEKSINHAISLMAKAVHMKHGQEIWLIGERPVQAEDNGYQFFKYCRETYPNRKAYYVIDRQSPHLQQVRQLGNVIYHSSWKHMVYMLAASKYISAWTTRESLMPSWKGFYQMFGSIVDSKTSICLQHGMIIHNISPYLHKELYGLNYIFCCSQREKQIIKNTLGYRDEEIFVTGLSRFDQLQKDTQAKRQILVMPTWRRYLAKQDQQFFVQSDFYRMYDRLLNNPRLFTLLKRHDYELVFYMHHNFQTFSRLFHSSNNRIQILTYQDVRIADLLKSSELLVTDYSSVATDFLYMKKPVLFYQFDPYHNHHSEVEEIRYRDIGDVVDDDQALINRIEDMLSGSIDVDRLERRRRRMFDQIDDQNSNRIYKQICNL